MNPQPIISLFIASGIVGALAWLQCGKHTWLIKAGLMTKEIHAQWAAWRLWMLGAFCMIECVLGHIDLFPAIALFIGSMGLFSYLFRVMLNKENNWDWNYIGGTSWYDIHVLALRMMIERGHVRSVARIALNHQRLYSSNGYYRGLVRRAGRMASEVELTLFFTGLTACLINAL